MKVVKFQERKIDPEMIRSIRVLLDKATSGEISDLCYVARIKGRWTYKCSTPVDTEDRLPFVGMLESVKQRLILMLDWGKI